MGVQLIVMFKPCKACALGKAKKTLVSKVAVPCSIIKCKRLLIDISSLPTDSMGSKKHWPLIVEDYIDHAWSYLLKEN